MPAEVTQFANDDGQSVVDLIVNERKESFLTIGGDTAIQTGYDLCDTCAYMFTKVFPAQKLTDGATEETAHSLSTSLRNLKKMPDTAALHQFGLLLPPGEYSVALITLTPELVIPGQANDYFAVEAVATWGLDPYFGVSHWPKTPYYRLGAKDLGAVDYGGKRLGLIHGVPLFPPTQRVMNKAAVIADYRKTLRAQETRPTVFALGLADDRGPAVWDDSTPEFSRHLVVTLFILDGHHKIAAAAAAEQMPIQFLTFFPHKYLGRDWLQAVSPGIDLVVSTSK